MFYLRVKPTGGPIRRVPLLRGSTLIGRLPDNTIALGEYGVSARHAEIEVADREVRIRDLGSTNGVHVNGQKVSDARLMPGDRVLLGSVLLVIEEAVSDRLLVRGHVHAASEPRSPLERPAGAPGESARAYVPVAARPDEREGAGEVSREDEGAVLALLERTLLESAMEGPSVGSLDRFLQAVLGVTGASAGCLVGCTARTGVVVRTSTGSDGGIRVRRDVVGEAVTARAPVCVEDTDPVERAIAGESASILCVPVELGSEVVGALYLVVPRGGVPTAQARLSAVDPVLPTLAWAMRCQQERDGRERMAEALLGGRAEMIGEAPLMKEALRTIEQLAGTQKNVLVRGPGGTGRALAARRIHALGERSRMPFLAVNCSTCSHHDLEAELFGEAVPGRERRGKIDLGRGGTLFLDEIADLPIELQRKLSEIALSWGNPADGDGSPPGDSVRLIASTAHDLADRVLRGGFDEDLYRRLAQGKVDLAPLRDRKEDIVPLARHFVHVAAEASHKRIVGLSMDACRALMDHDWKGNVRELRDVLSRAVLLAEDEILDVDALPLDVAAGQSDALRVSDLAAVADLSWRDAKTAFEKAYFAEVLRRNGGNVSKSARTVGIARKNVYHKMKHLGLAPR